MKDLPEDYYFLGRGQMSLFSQDNVDVVLVPVYQGTRQHIPENSQLRNHCCENPIFHKGHAWVQKNKPRHISQSYTSGT